MRFVWDAKKAAANLKKHGVSFEEASTIFGDPFAMTFPDPDHSYDEDRFLTFGLSVRGRLIVASQYGPSDTICLISARSMTAREQRDYERSERR